MADKRVIFFSDNAAVVDIVNNQTSKHQGIMVLLREFSPLAILGVSKSIK